ncbi:MAG: hypothetical protein GY835_05005 [bacterium]|nr:hypothetical protein [bacterium]
MKRAILTALILCLTIPCTTPATPPAPALKPAVAPSPPESYVDAPYKKLGSEAFVEDYDGKLLHFKAMFVGEWTLTNVYEMIGGISTRNRVFINHRDVSYVAQQTGLGSSDAEFPPFALSVPKSKSDLVYELSRGDVFEVWGRAEKANLLGKTGLHVSADRVARAAQTPK